MKKWLLLVSLLVSFAHGQVRAVELKDYRRCQDLLENENALLTEHMSSADRSELELCRISDSLHTIEIMLGSERTDIDFEFWDTMWDQGIPIWFHLLEAYCEFHPSAPYVDVLGHVDHCGSKPRSIHTRSGLEKYFGRSIVFNNNVSTFMHTQPLKSNRQEKK